MPTVADLIVQRLRDAGVRTLFGMPGGGSNLDVLEAAANADLELVLTSTETAGALAAMAQAEITGRPGACLTTLGPGVASVVNGMACALLDRAPLVVFTDSHPAAGLKTYEHQRLDHSSLLTPVAKWSSTLTPETALETVDRAIATAVAWPPGPVHLDCPGDVASAPVPDLASGAGAAVSALRDELTDADLDATIVSLLSRARRPLLLVGLGARRLDDATAIRELCERCGLPAMVTYKAKGVVPDDHPWFAGVFTNGAIEQPLIAESDLLVGVGLDPVELIPRPWKPSQPVLYCGRGAVSDSHVPYVAQIVASLPSALRAIGRHFRQLEWNPDRIRQGVDEQTRRIQDPGVGLTAQRVVEIAGARLARRSRVTVDAGAHMFPATMLWPVCEPNQMLISNGLSTMGFALPAAIGAALIDPERCVVALTGDGGLLMCLGELLTAVREKLRVITIVFSDASLSLIEIKQQQRRLHPSGVALGSIDWPGLAESFGVAAYRAESADQLERAVDEAQAGSGPSLIEARIDRSHYGNLLRAIRG